MNLPPHAFEAMSEAARTYRTSVAAIRNPALRNRVVSTARRSAAESLAKYPAKDVARWMSMSPSTVWNWRKGQPRSDGNRLVPVSLDPLPPRIHACIEAVARRHGVLIGDILSDWRNRHICRVRRAAMNEVALMQPKPSVEMIARWFGRHRSVVTRAIRGSRIKPVKGSK